MVTIEKQIKVVFVILYLSAFITFQAIGECPSADLSGDCKVDLEDFAVFASQWLDEGMSYPIINVMTWVSINDPGIDGHEGFYGGMSKYETTNAQYCEYLNSAISSDTIEVNGNYVVNASYPSQYYYNLTGTGYTNDGAINGGAARIHWTGNSFYVDSGFENHPVTYVSWYGATAFANYYGWRLPTEWEWQAVADYDGSFTYGCGTILTNTMANYLHSSHPDGTTVVGSYGTYGYGMCDMSGNVWEWTRTIDGDRGVFCGGSWHLDYDCSVSHRDSSSLYAMGLNLGFRVCR